MKKILFITASLVLLFFTSCEGPMGPQGPQGRPGQDGLNGENGIANRVILDYSIQSHHWERVEDNNKQFLYYQVLINESELDEYVYNNAAIVAYLEYWENDYTIQKALPTITNHEDNDGIFWFQTIDFDYGVNSIAFRVSNSDFREDAPGNMHFRVVFVW